MKYCFYSAKAFFPAAFEMTVKRQKLVVYIFLKHSLLFEMTS